MKIALAIALATALATPALANCGDTITFDQMARTPQQHMGQVVMLCGRVDQVQEDGFIIMMRVAIQDNYNRYSNVIVVIT